MNEFERLENWCLNNLKNNPKSIGFNELNNFLKSTKTNVLKKSNIESNINKSIKLLDQIKIGNTPKYQALKNDLKATLQNVLKELE